MASTTPTRSGRRGPRLRRVRAVHRRALSRPDLPRHLSHFTTATLEAVIEKASGRVVWTWHQAKPRTYLWSLSAWLTDRCWGALARATERRAVYGVLKLGLELLVRLARGARRGEAIRIGAVQNRPT